MHFQVGGNSADMGLRRSGQASNLTVQTYGDMSL